LPSRRGEKHEDQKRDFKNNCEFCGFAAWREIEINHAKQSLPSPQKRKALKTKFQQKKQRLLPDEI